MSSETSENRNWKTWQDWTNLVLGVLLALTPLFAEFDKGSTWAVVMGIIIAVVAIWSLATASSKASEWLQIIASDFTFFTPWFGGFSWGSGAWWTWVLAVVAVILAATTLSSSDQK